MMTTNNKHGTNETGFVLPTALLLLTLLTMLATTMYYVSRSSMVTSSAANSSTVAIYYAETAIHYMSWAVSNDAEFDSFDYKYIGGYVRGTPTPTVPANTPQVGDRSELFAYLWDPGPTGAAGSSASDSVTAYNVGQVLYFDNSPMGTRHLCLENATLFPNCIDVTLKKKDRAEPLMFQVSTKLPRYIKLDISAGDSTKNPVVLPSIVASIPSLPHRTPPQVEHNQLADGTYDHNGDIPKNGAIVWLTAGDPFNSNHDLELFPLDPTNKYANIIPPASCHITPDLNSNNGFIGYNHTDPANGCPCLQVGGQVNTGSISLNNGIHWEAISQSGNDIIIQYVLAGSSMPLTVGAGTVPIDYPNQNAVVLSVSLATDNMGVPTSTASDVINAANTYLTDPNVLADPNTPVEFSTLTAFAWKALDNPTLQSNGTGVVSINSRTLVHLNGDFGCNANTGEWLPGAPSYNIVAYAIGYVNGKPSHMLRAIIK